MNALAWLAVILVVIWLVAVVFFKVIGFAIHILLIAAACMFIAWAARKFTGGGSAAP